MEQRARSRLELRQQTATLSNQLQLRIKSGTMVLQRRWSQSRLGQFVATHMPRRKRRSAASSTSQQARWPRIVHLTSLLTLFGILVGTAAFMVLFAVYARELPRPGEVVRRSGFSTKIMDRNGQLLYDLFADQRRTPVDIADVPEHLKHATVAIEDKDFYKHSGFDVLTIGRIPYNMLFKNRVVGGSTLTQQLVKNALLTNERSVERKFKELVLSLQIERTFSKDEILEFYLNEAPYGGNLWGVGTAAEVYFDKPVAEVSILESAILAGLPQRPTAYSPHSARTNEDGELLWQVRTKGVLRRMLEDGYIAQAEYSQALDEMDEIAFQPAAIDIEAPHFVFYVRDELAKMYGEDAVSTAGFQVTTSLDLNFHTAVQDIVSSEVKKVENLDISNGAALVMDPESGQILSMVGSRDYANASIGGQYNVVVDGLRQPGSAIKPLTYLALIRQGYTPGSMLADVPTTFAPNDQVDPYEPNNYDGKFRGPVTIRNSLGSSLNIPAVKALGLVGVDNFLNLAYDMGLETLAPTAANMQRFGLAVTLGGAEVHMLDLGTAYSAFANEGKRVEPVSILEIRDRDGQLLFQHRPLPGRQVISRGEAFLINHILSDNNARSLAFGTGSLLNAGPGVAVKTGTTNDQRDNWAIGWMDKLLVAAWVGNNDNSAMKSVTSGISGATPIWRSIIDYALENGYSAPEWVAPEDEIDQMIVDPISGYPEHDDFGGRQEFALKGTFPSLPDPIHQKIKLCEDEFKLATPAEIGKGDYDEREFIVMRESDPVSEDGINRWQIGIDNWIEASGDQKYSPPTEYCGDEDDLYIEIRDPDDEKNYEETEIDIKIDAAAPEGVESIKLYVDGKKVATYDSDRVREKINLEPGAYELQAKLEDKDGNEERSNKVRIGVGGVDWEGNEVKQEEESDKEDSQSEESD